MSDFAKTRAVFLGGVQSGLHPGAQLYVARSGEVLIDEAFGQARDGVVMQRDSLMLWLSAGKPITAAAIGQLVERGRLNWETRVAEAIPEFAARGKEAVTVRHLLTHTAGLRHAEALDAALGWNERVASLCALPLEPEWIPGQRAGYHISGTWHLLGEVVQRISGQPLDQFVRENIFHPLGARSTALTRSDEEISAQQENVAFVYDTSGGASRPNQEWNNADSLTRCIPGGSARGPVRELGRFYESLRRGGENMLRRETVRAMTARQRMGMFDETFQFRMDAGLGFILNSNLDGVQMPYGYGRHASRETFGHSGNQSSCAYCDPQRELVVAWACNGLPGERSHQQRQRAINNAIYEDLELTKPLPE